MFFAHSFIGNPYTPDVSDGIEMLCDSSSSATCSLRIHKYTEFSLHLLDAGLEELLLFLVALGVW